MDRIYSKYIKQFMKKKLLLVCGPRQTGKTYLTRELISDDLAYLNFDLEEDREMIREKSWTRDKELVIFDELHKKDKWKSWPKGYMTKKETLLL